MLKLKKISLLIALCVVALFVGAHAAQAQKSTIAIVDMDKILKESLAGKSLETQLKEKREAFQQEFSQRENELLEREKTLIQEKSSLSPDAFEKKRKEFELKLLETRNLFQKRRNALDKGLNNALEQLREEVMQVTASISDKEGYSMVITRGSVVIADQNLDITEQILKQIDSSMKNITLTVAQ